MSRTDSYLDWELSFRKKGDQPRSSYRKKINSHLNKDVNSLGIPKNKFKEFFSGFLKLNVDLRQILEKSNKEIFLCYVSSP